MTELKVNKCPFHMEQQAKIQYEIPFDADDRGRQVFLECGCGFVHCPSAGDTGWRQCPEELSSWFEGQKEYDLETGAMVLFKEHSQ